MPKRTLTEEERRKIGERLKKGREAKSSAEAEVLGGTEPALTLTGNESGPALSDDEYARIREAAEKQVAEELAERSRQERVQLMEQMAAAELQRQRKEAGLTDYRDDILDVLIDVPEFTDHIAINGKKYQLGQWYKVDRRTFDSLREIMDRAHHADERSETRISGRRRTRRQVAAGNPNPFENEHRYSDGTLSMYPRGANLNGRTGVTTGVVPVGVT